MSRKSRLEYIGEKRRAYAKSELAGGTVPQAIIVAREEAMAVILLTEPKRVTRVQSQK